MHLAQHFLHNRRRATGGQRQDFFNRQLIDIAIRYSTSLSVWRKKSSKYSAWSEKIVRVTSRYQHGRYGGASAEIQRGEVSIGFHVHAAHVALHGGVKRVTAARRFFEGEVKAADGGGRHRKRLT